MIKVLSLTIEEFRGIRNLSLDLKGKNFAVCGPNGTGKSGVVDALEFVLTGSISRLTGEGRGEISLKQHAPHVDRRNDPQLASVSVELEIPSLGKSVTVTRRVSQPRTPVISSTDPDVLSVLKQVEAHPEFVLSRRELIKYVLATPGQRSEDVGALLHLQDITDVRERLLRIANAAEKKTKVLEQGVKDSRENLLKALGIAELTVEKVLDAANVHRVTLALPPLTTFTETGSLKDGILSIAAGQGPTKLSKGQATQDMAGLRALLVELGGTKLAAEAQAAKILLESLIADPWAQAGLDRENFLAKGLELTENDLCPYCDTPWDVEALKVRVIEKLGRLKELALKRKSAETAIQPLQTFLDRLSMSLQSVVRQAASATPPHVLTAVSEYAKVVRVLSAALSAFLPLQATLAAVDGVGKIPAPLESELTAFDGVIAKLPEPTKQDSARDWLAVAQERLEVYRDSRRKHLVAKGEGERARVIYSTFISTSEGILTGLYANVEKDFSRLYSEVNKHDEQAFTAKLIPSAGKLGFDVNFYDRGFFPPGAYHSEGHQDGMGLCLYLALMRYLQKDQFTFAVLDDVLMSVDAGHRREVCRVLKQEFPDTQFIITTHDPIWLRHMKTEGMLASRSSIQFKNWSVDHGPMQWDDRDIWNDIEHDLVENDVRGAAARLRHYLEYIGGEVCHRLRARVEFRGDAQYQLGQLLPPAVARMNELYRIAKNAANSWKQLEKVATLDQSNEAFNELVRNSWVEQWQVNVAVHYNNWENLTPQDFRPVVSALRALLEGFECPSCHVFLRVLPDREEEATLQCDCGSTSINLSKQG